MKRTLGWFFSVVIMLAVAIPAFSAQGASSQSNKSQVFSYLTQEIGFNTAAACGIMANIEHESGFDSSLVLYDSNGLLSGGLCMWNGGRFSSLQRFCNNNGYNYLGIYGQLKYLEHELQSDYYEHIYDYLKSVSNDPNGAYNAAYYWCYYFEVPANRSYQANRRGGVASSEYWDEFSYLSAEPETPKLKSEKSGKTVDIGSKVKFTWSSGGDGATRYVLLLAKKSNGKYNFSKAKKYKTTSRSLSVTVPEGGDYAAKVYSVNDYTGEKSSSSGAVYFKSKCLEHSNKFVGAKEPTFTAPGINLYSCKKCSAQTLKVVSNITQEKFSAIKPTGLKKIQTTASSVTIGWNHISGAQGYLIRIKLPSGKWEDVATVKNGTYKYTIKNLSPSTEYKFAIRAFAQNGEKKVNTQFAAVKATTAKIKAKITDIDRVSKGKVKLTWKKNTLADGYKVYVSTSPKGGYKVAAELPATTTSFTVKSLKSGTCYYFIVKAFTKTENGRVYSEPSPVKYAYAL